MKDVMENVLSVYRSKLLAHDIAVESKFTDLRKISVRTGEIIQIFSNVVCNAIDSMPHGGVLSIRTTRTVRMEEDAIQVVVSDSGTGIRREHLDKVFEPFFTTKGNLGTGIGLWVTKQLVERHGGQISLSSSTDRGNSGTTVTMTFPFRGGENKQAGSRQGTGTL
jgi:signal transduction histidine kinase